MENKIKLVQKPIIEHRLKEIGKSVTDRLAELNLEKQVATIDTVGTLKKLRAELNKESAAWTERLKFAKKTYFGEIMNDIDIYNIDEDKLLGLFEQMVRLHYTQM